MQGRGKKKPSPAVPKRSQAPGVITVNSKNFLRAQRKWRQAVTGDPKKRIRDHMKETPQVKMLDKFSFTLGNSYT